MSLKYRILWAEAAEKDLTEIIDHIAIDNPADAAKILQEIKQQAASLYTFPERGRIVRELHENGIHFYRELVIPPWRMIYRISDTDVYVSCVFDSRRNVEDILMNRLVGL